MAKNINKLSYDDIKDEKLGAIYSKEKTTFRVFSSNRNKVEVLLAKDYKIARKDRYSMIQNNIGIYEITLEGDYAGYYYNYLVEDEYIVTDPYTLSSSINSTYSVVMDMKSSDPEGFRKTKVPHIPLNKAILYEMSIKDYTSSNTSGVIEKGKYLGLCEEGTFYNDVSTALDNIKELGITHAQLLPIFDFISVDENSDKFFDDNNYNRGYDPELFFVPEGSYSSNPNDPKSRVIELKKMIQSFHKNDIAVIMDVVYNHTFKSYDSNLETLAPGYYHRRNSDGSYSNGSGVGNEIASEKAFGRKLIIDSLLHRVNEYKIDGFRFDLMALIDIDTIEIALKKLREINPNIIFYGEPRMALGTTLSYDKQILKGSQRSKDFGVFNDIYRDLLKGDPNSYGKGYLQGDFFFKDQIELAIAGSIAYDNRRIGFTDYASESINYFNCHDNLILYDKLKISLDNLEHIDSYVKLAIGFMMLSFGIPFMFEGNEFNQSKNNDRNSYKSPLSINAVDWAKKEENLEIFNYTKELIKLRKDVKVFEEIDPYIIRENLHFMDNLPDYLIVYKIQKSAGYLLVIINSSKEDEIIKKKDLNNFIEKKYNSFDKIFGKRGKDNISIKLIDDNIVEKLSVNVYKIGV